MPQNPKTPTPAPNLSAKQLSQDEAAIERLAKSKGITHAAAAAELLTQKHNLENKAGGKTEPGVVSDVPAGLPPAP